MLKGYDAIVLRVSVGAIYRGSELGVLACQVLFRDPTGTGTEASNRYRDFIRYEELHQLRQRRYAHAVNLLGDMVLYQRRRLSHENEARLVSPLDGPLGHGV